MCSLIGSLLGDAGYHLPLALPAFLTGVLVVVQLCSVASGHPPGAQFGLMPQLGAQKVSWCLFGQ